jgi:hypothetical protein
MYSLPLASWEIKIDTTYLQKILHTNFWNLNFGPASNAAAVLNNPIRILSHPALSVVPNPSYAILFLTSIVLIVFSMS